MSSDASRKFRVLELFAGIGGLHWALKVASVPCKVVTAMEINPTVMEIYSHNFREVKVVSKNLQGITAKEINELHIDAIVMSPPCQPFCRMGNRLDIDDNRTGPLSQLTNILTEVNFKYIFVENVQGFENSTAREHLLEVLCKLNFKWQEFMLNPKSVGVPNSRLRYYLIGKHSNIPWSFRIEEGVLLSEIPSWHSPSCMPFEKLKLQYEEYTKVRRKRWKDQMTTIASNNDQTRVIPEELSFCVGDIIEWDLCDKLQQQLKLSNSTLRKYYQAMDIVTPSSTNTCCFTKGYGHFVKGTGSILRINGNISAFTDDNIAIKDTDAKVATDTEKDILNLRYFSPKEISRLMSYPEEFEFPMNLSLGQKYRSLGNSVNVYIVAILFSLLFSAVEK